MVRPLDEEGLSEILNKIGLNLEMLLNGRDAITGEALTMADVKQLASGIQDEKEKLWPLCNNRGKGRIESAFAAILNRKNYDTEASTPDFLLGRLLAANLHTFIDIINEREKWWMGHQSKLTRCPGCGKATEWRCGESSEEYGFVPLPRIIDAARIMYQHYEQEAGGPFAWLECPESLNDAPPGADEPGK